MASNSGHGLIASRFLGDSGPSWVNPVRTVIILALMVALGMVGLLTGSTAASAAPISTTVAELTIYSDGHAAGAGSAGLIEGHAWISVKNTSGAPITVGTLSGVLDQQQVSVGTWGNQTEHVGVWYNLESYHVHNNQFVYSDVSLTRSITSAQLKTLNSFIGTHDSYDTTLYLNNCSTFASGAWNSVMPWEWQVRAQILPLSPDTPTGLMSSIMENGSYVAGRAAFLQWNAVGVWYGNGKKAPIRSMSFPGAAPNVTFDDVPIGTTISTQYANKGIVISGTAPTIQNDGANPTSPVLSPGPGYSGTIDFTFVDPKTSKATTASAISFDIGYMDSVGGATISWYSPRGILIGSRKTDQFAIERVLIDAIGVAKVHIDTTTDPAGAAVDNLQFSLNTK